MFWNTFIYPNLAHLATHHSVILRCHLLFGFSVSAGPRDESPRTSSLTLSLLVDAACYVGVTASCDEDVGDVGEDELVGRPRTTNGT